MRDSKELGNEKVNVFVAAMDCTFETDICGFVQMNDDNMDWTRHIGTTSSDYTGPDHDHTTGSGKTRFSLS